MGPDDQNYEQIQNKIEQNYPAFVAMPSWILCDARLKATDKILIMVMNLYREYRPDYGEIQWLAGIGKKTAQKALARLEALGYIETIKNDGRGKTYRLAREW